jgi:hypothetical protein
MGKIRTYMNTLLCNLERHDWEWSRVAYVDDFNAGEIESAEDAIPFASCTRCNACKGGGGFQ